MTRFFAAASVVGISCCAFATTYYVSSSTGSDANAGTSSSAAWQTVAKVNAAAFSPGDSILFKRGDVWNEALVVPSSGSSVSPISFDAYGAGAAPNLTGYYAIPASGWTFVTGNAWRANVPSTFSTISFCLFGSIWGHKVPGATSASLVSKGDFYFVGGTLRVYSVGNPATYYGATIVPMAVTNTPLIQTNGKSWLTFQHFLLNWFDSDGVFVSGASDHLVFANMEADSMIPQGAQPIGFYVSESAQPLDIKIYNSEVRAHDYGWGVANDRNLLGRFNTETFTLVRLARSQTYFMRLYDGSTPPRYSRYAAGVHVDYPL